jgi:hypothetical protein
MVGCYQSIISIDPSKPASQLTMYKPIILGTIAYSAYSLPQIPMISQAVGVALYTVAGVVIAGNAYMRYNGYLISNGGGYGGLASGVRYAFNMGSAGNEAASAATNATTTSSAGGTDTTVPYTGPPFGVSVEQAPPIEHRTKLD